MAEEQTPEQAEKEQEQGRRTGEPEGALDTREIVGANERASAADADVQPMEDGQSHSPDPEAAEKAAQEQEKSE